MASTTETSALRGIAHVSRLLRAAISAALPLPGDQYLTVSIPGTIIDVRDIDAGGSYVWTPTATNDPLMPLAVQQAESKLVDGMMPLANVMLGTTGRSVSRSYNRALDLLVPLKAGGSPGLESQPADPRYTAAMTYLCTPDASGRTPIDYYILKQSAWQQAQSDWDTARADALASFMRPSPLSGINTSSPSLEVVQQSMNEWNQLNFRQYKTAVQGKWMDWVVHGNKYEVENSFGVVDIESIMARIESSKESWRNSTIVDDDGANELQGVQLAPRNWASLCAEKVEGWRKLNGGFSYEQLMEEIERLHELRLSMEALKMVVMAGEFPVSSASEAGEVEKAPPATDEESGKPKDPSPSPFQVAESGLRDAFEALYREQGQINALHVSKASESTIALRRNEVEAAQRVLRAALQTYREQYAVEEKQKLRITGDAQAWADAQMTSIDDTIQRLQALPLAPSSSPSPERQDIPALAGINTDADNPAVTAAALARSSDTKERAVFRPAPDSDPTAASIARSAGAASWTAINVSSSASAFAQSQDSSSWDMNVSGGMSYGLFSMGGAYSHEESKSDMYSDMAKCDVDISFEAMVVNIYRPWLYGELFGDNELDVATGIMLSPGPAKLQEWLKNVEGNANSLNDYTMFSSYPTSFIVAANTVIEFTGSTSHIEQHFSSHSNSGSLSFGYGPFSMSGSFHEEASSANVQIQSTATGCKIKFGNPQIIAWASQILPALPRPDGFDPLITKFV